VSLYLDTSALVKWYVAESDSDAFDDFLAARSGASISRLTIVELRSALARRRRNPDISAATERAALALFDTHVRDGLLMVLALQDSHFAAAREIIDNLPRIALRTLDAVHLAVVRANAIASIATADPIMASAARALRLETHVFH
jgi:predicted nucleic acid-binding protein